MTNKYFANEEGDKLLDELNKRKDEYYEYLESSGRLRQMRLAYANYYGNDGLHSSQELQLAGDQGELNVLKVNDYRNLLQHILVMATANRPAVECRATNNDASSYEQTILGDAVVEYYLRAKKFENLIIQAAECCLVLDEGAIELPWNQNRGKEIAVNPETGEVIREGDIEGNLLTPIDVIRNPYHEDLKHNWYIVRQQVNKYDLAAEFPEQETKILDVSDRMDQYALRMTPYNRDLNDELIYVYTFYHAKTPAVPQGKVVKFVNDVMLIPPSPLPYEEVPIIFIQPAKQIKTSFGYSVGRDLLALQQINDALHSALASMHIRFGVQSIVGPKGADIDIQELGAGMRYFELDPKMVDMLKPLNLTAVPGTIFDHLSINKQAMETISAINSTVRGNPETNLKSGAALSVVHSTAVQFNRGFQDGVSQLIEGVGNTIIKHLQRFPMSQRMISIVGKTNLEKVKQFTKDDIKFISAVTCEVTNPLTKTLAGKLEMAQDLLDKGMIKRPEQYITLIETGRFEPLVDNEMNELIAIQDTKEAIIEGENPEPLITDNHPLYIIELKGLISTRESRKQPDLVDRVLLRIQKQYDLWRSADPVMLQAMGIQPFPGPVVDQQNPQQGPVGDPAQLASPENPIEAQADQVKPAGMPTNPLTGKKYDPNLGE